MQEVVIRTPFIKLDALLKFAGVCASGGVAKLLIEQGEVRVNGEICVQRGHKCYPGDAVMLGDHAMTLRAE